MKIQSVAYYNAYGGVYKRPQLAAKGYGRFFAGIVSLLMITGITFVTFGSNFKLNYFINQHTSVVSRANSRLVASTAAQPSVTTQPVKVSGNISSDIQTSTSTSDQLLTGELESALAAAKPVSSTTSWGVSIYDINNQKWLIHNNGQQQMSSASLYKLYAVYGLANKVPFEKWSAITVAGQSLQDCVDKMLRLSDNTCGVAVGKYVGWKAIDNYVHAAGFNGTSLNTKAGPQTTADDTTRFMASLYQGKLLDAAVTNFLLNSLQNQKLRQAIPAGCAGCTTYNKTGNEAGIAHDSAIVISGSKTYAVTIMSSGQGSYGQIAVIERALQGVLQ